MVNNNIRMSIKKAKKEMKNESDVNDGLGAFEITLGNLQHKTAKSN